MSFYKEYQKFCNQVDNVRVAFIENDNILDKRTAVFARRISL